MFRFSLKDLFSLVLVVAAAGCSPEHESQTAPIEWNLVGEYLGQQRLGSEVEAFAPSHGHESTGGDSSLWISFRGEDGAWLAPRHVKKSSHCMGSVTRRLPQSRVET